MVFGHIKSKIEKKLTDSFLNNSFKKEIGVFKKLVLENEGLSKAFHIYNELGENKSLNERFAEDFLEECIDLYNRIEIDQRTFSKLTNWIKGVVCENKYQEIDNALNIDSVLIEERIKCKNSIIENLKKKKEEKSTLNVPIPKMLEVANKNLQNYLTTLNESDLNEIKKYKLLTEEDLQNRYLFLSEMVIEKLEKIKNGGDSETAEKIDETITKIKKQKIDTLSFVKLKNFNETL